MQTVKILSPAEREAYRGFTTVALYNLLRDAEYGERTLAIGALSWPSPVGLALVEFGRAEHPMLRSIAVAKSARRQGIGRALLRATEEELRRRGESAVIVQLFPRNGEPEPAFSSLLTSVGWSPLRPAGIFCKTNYGRLLDAPWAQCHTFPANFEVFRWADLTPEEEARLLSKESGGPSWFPPQLNPCTHRNLVHVPTSVGLRYRGELIGWCVTYAFGANDLTVASLFVKEAFQPRGHAIRLLAYAIRNAHDSGRDEISFNVGVGMTGMLQFFHKHMTPYVTSTSTLFRSVTILQPREDQLSQTPEFHSLLA